MQRKSWTEDSQEGRGPARGAGCRPWGAGLGVSLGISHWLRAGEVGEAEIPVAPSSLLGFGSSGAARLPPPTESQRGPRPGSQALWQGEVTGLGCSTSALERCLTILSPKCLEVSGFTVFRAKPDDKDPFFASSLTTALPGRIQNRLPGHPQTG